MKNPRILLETSDHRQIHIDEHEFLIPRIQIGLVELADEDGDNKLPESLTTIDLNLKEAKLLVNCLMNWIGRNDPNP